MKLHLRTRDAKRKKVCNLPSGLETSLIRLYSEDICPLVCLVRLLELASCLSEIVVTRNLDLKV